MGHAKAEARARAEAAQIEMQGMLEQVLPKHFICPNLIHFNTIFLPSHVFTQ